VEVAAVDFVADLDGVVVVVGVAASVVVVAAADTFEGCAAASVAFVASADIEVDAFAFGVASCAAVVVVAAAVAAGYWVDHRLVTEDSELAERVQETEALLLLAVEHIVVPSFAARFDNPAVEFHHCPVAFCLPSSQGRRREIGR
jgi:hypothetical protein